MTTIRSERDYMDKGWSWLIAASTCFIHMMMYGMARLSGVLFVATYKEYPVSRREASLPYTLASAVRNCLGPVVGLLGHKFGVLPVTAAGAVIGALGILTCFWARDVVFITWMWGGVFGIGFGLGNSLIPVRINQYFDKYRATASGISFAGACLGSFFLPPLVDVLLINYGLHGTFLIMSGLVLNCLPMSLILIDPPKVVNRESVVEIKDDQSTKQGLVNPSFTLDESKTREDDFDLSSQKECIDSPITCNELDKVNNVNKNIFLQKFEVEMKIPTEVVKEKEKKIEDVPITFHMVLKLWSSPSFLLICLTSGLYGFCFVSIVTIVVDFAIDIGIEESKAKYVLMSFSIAEVLGRLLLGLFADKICLSSIEFNILSFVLHTITCIFVGLSKTFWTLTVAMCVYGFFESGLIIIFPLLIAELIDKHLQIVAMASANFIYGPVTVAIPYVIGYFREGLGSYELVFYTLAGISLACAILWIIFKYYYEGFGKDCQKRWLICKE